MTHGVADISGGTIQYARSREILLGKTAMIHIMCSECDAPVDTDDDPGAYDEAGNYPICERCREKREMEGDTQ